MKTRQLALSPGAKIGHHPLMPHFKIPLVRGRAPSGDEVAQALKRVLHGYHLCFRPPARDSLTELASWLSTNSTRLLAVRRKDLNPLAGVLTRSVAYPLFIQAQDEAATREIRDAVRALALSATSASEHPRGTKSAIESIGRNFGPTPLSAHCIAIGGQVYAALAVNGENRVQSVYDALVDLMGAQSARAVASLLPDVDALADMTRKTATERKPRGVRLIHRPPTPESRPPPPEEAPPEDYGWTETEVDPAELPDDIDEEPGDQTAADDESTNKCWTEAAQRHEQTRRALLYLTGPMLPDTERALSLGEARAFGRYCQDAMSGDVSARNAEGVEMACSGLLALMTGRDIEYAHSAVVTHLLGSRTLDKSLQLHADRWTGSAPIKYPEIGALEPAWFEGTTALTLPMPACMVRALRSLKQIQNRPPASQGAATKWLHNARAECGTPRITVTRLLNTLPTLLYLVTGHARDWQLICGQSGQRSTAPLHYFAPTQAELERAYSAALLRVDVDIPESGCDEAQRTGAPRANVTLPMARLAIDALRERTATPGKADLEERIDRYNRMVAYTAGMFAFTVAHRMTDEFAEFCRRDLLRIGDLVVATVYDKGADPVVATRVAALPQRVMSQIDTLLRHAKRLSTALRQSASDDWISAIAALEDSLQGRGPLWVIIRCDGGLQKVTRKSLAELWPEWKAPLPLVRHMLATHLTNFGARPADVAQQMGHEVDTTPYTGTDPESPLDFSRRISPAIDAYLDYLGWKCVGDIARRNQEIPPLDPMSAKTVLNCMRCDERTYQALKQNAPKTAETEVTVELQALARETARKGLKSNGQWDRIALLRAVREAQAKLGEAETRLFRPEVQRSAKEMAPDPTKVPTVPLRLRMPEAMSEIRRCHLDAYRCALAMEGNLVNQLEVATANGDNDLGCIAAWMLMIAEGLPDCVSNPDRMLNADATVYWAPDWQRNGLVTYSLGADADGSRRALMAMPEQSLHLLAYLRGVQAIEPVTTDRLKAALKQSPGPRALLEKSENALSTATALLRAARRLTVSGQRVAWERGALGSVGPNEASLLAVNPTHEASLHGERRIESEFSAPTDAYRKYMQLRSTLHKWQKEPHRKAARQQLQQCAQSVAKEASETTLIGIVARLLLQYVESGVPKWRPSSAYTRLTMLSPLVRSHANEDYTISDLEPLMANIRGLLLQYERGGAARERQNRGSFVAAIQWLALGAEEADIHLPLDEIFDGLAIQAHRQPGYWINSDEVDAITAQLGAWHATAINSAADPVTSTVIARSELAVRITAAAALRIGECAALFEHDVSLKSDGLGISVHPRRKHSLKAVASKRYLHAPMSKEHLSRISYIHERLRAMQPHTDSFLGAARREPVAATVHEVSLWHNHASAAVAPSRRLRMHAHRHTYATGAGLQITAIGGVGWAPPVRFEAILERMFVLPARIEYLYASRRLGHGSPLTTLQWYDHSVPIVTPEPRVPIPQHLMAALIRISLSNLRKSLQRAPERPLWAAPLQAVQHSPIDCSPKPPSPELPEAIVPTRRWISLSGRVALAVRSGADYAEISDRLGIPKGLTQLLVDHVKHSDALLGTGYLTSRHRAPSERQRRMPRAHDVLSVLGQLDTSTARNIRVRWPWLLYAELRAKRVDRDELEPPLASLEPSMYPKIEKIVNAGDNRSRMVLVAIHAGLRLLLHG